MSSVSIEAYERRIKKLEREKSELSWKLQESTKVLQEQSIVGTSRQSSMDSSTLTDEVSMLRRKNKGTKYCIWFGSAVYSRTKKRVEQGEKNTKGYTTGFKDIEYLKNVFQF